MKTIFLKARLLFIQHAIHTITIPFYRIMFTTKTFPFKQDTLQHFNSGSIGKLLFRFLEINKLNLLKDYESHDIKHVLFGYPPDEKGEACLQFFMLGNKWFSSATFLVCFHTILLYPENWSAFYIAYKKGKKYKALKTTNWYEILPYSLKYYRQSLKK